MFVCIFTDQKVNNLFFGFVSNFEARTQCKQRHNKRKQSDRFHVIHSGSLSSFHQVIVMFQHVLRLLSCLCVCVSFKYFLAITRYLLVGVTGLDGRK